MMWSPSCWERARARWLVEGSRRKERKTFGSELAIVVRRGWRWGLAVANLAQEADAAAVASERPWHWPVARCTRVPGVSGAHPGTRQWPEESLLQ